MMRTDLNGQVGTAAGDLGRRIAARRRELGLSRAEVAARARMAVEYLEYLENRTGSPGQGTLVRLAAVLDTSVDRLLGGQVDRPAGRRPRRARAELRKLSRDDCLRLIGAGGVGRIAVDVPHGPLVLPVNYQLVNGAVEFRTAEGSDLARLLPGREVAFEVDHIDEPQSEGWSVLVQGVASRVDPAGPASRRSQRIEPWGDAESRKAYLRISVDRVTGRRITHQ